MDEDVLDFNFWPSFADLMLALVLVLLLLLFIFTAIITVGTVNLEHVKQRQRKMVDFIAASYSVKAVPLPNEQDVYGISIDGTDDYDIQIRNEPTLQRITFSDEILFVENMYDLNASGRGVLLKVGTALKNELPNIREIQIQGHADPAHTRRHGSNVRLAAFRAIEVYTFLENDVGIDPAKHLMSATSFGEYKPVTRVAGEGAYSRNRLALDNATPEMKAKNRRIELLLFY